MIIGLHYKKEKLVEILNVMMFHDIKLLFINKDVAFFEKDTNLTMSNDTLEDGWALSDFRDALDEKNYLDVCDSGKDRDMSDFVFDGDREELINTDDFPKEMFDWHLPNGDTVKCDYSGV